MNAHNPFHNLSDAQLADRIGELDVAAKRAEATLKAAKETFIARCIDSTEGARFKLTKSESIRHTLDAAAVKKALGESWVSRHSKATPVVSVRVTARKEALVAA